MDSCRSKTKEKSNKMLKLVWRMVCTKNRVSFMLMLISGKTNSRSLEQVGAPLLFLNWLQRNSQKWGGDLPTPKNSNSPLASQKSDTFDAHSPEFPVDCRRCHRCDDKKKGVPTNEENKNNSEAFTFQPNPVYTIFIHVFPKTGRSNSSMMTDTRQKTGQLDANDARSWRKSWQKRQKRCFGKVMTSSFHVGNLSVVCFQKHHCQ